MDLPQEISEEGVLGVGLVEVPEEEEGVNVVLDSPAAAIDNPVDPSRRKSVRARKPVAVLSPTAAVAKKAKRKSVSSETQPPKKQKLAASPVVEPRADTPVVKKIKKTKNIANSAPVNPPLPIAGFAPVIEPFAAAPPIEIPSFVPCESFPKKISKFARADVPPIPGLPRYANMRMGKVLPAEKPPLEVEAAVPPPPEEELMVVLVTEPNPVVDISSNPGSPDFVKKTTPTAMELFLKSQPKVFSFAQRKEEKIIEAAMGVDYVDDDNENSNAKSNKTTISPITVIPTPSFELYVSHWKSLSKSSLSAPPRTYISRDASGVARPILPHSVGSKKASVYAGDNPLTRKRSLRPRPVYIAIHDRERPPVKFLVAHASLHVDRRHPLACDPLIDYDRDSDEEWAEENDGEDLNSNADEEEEKEECASSDSGDSFLVSDGHFSDDEALSDDEAMVVRKRRGQMVVDSEGKTTLQLIAFAPRDFEKWDLNSCGPNETAWTKWMQTVVDEANIVVFDPSSYFRVPTMEVAQKQKKTPPVLVNWTALRPVLARFIHAKSANIDSLSSEFKAIAPLTSQNAIKAEIRSIAAWTKKTELLPRIAWFVKPELFQDLNLDEDEMTKLVEERKSSSASGVNVLPFKPEPTEKNLLDRAAIHN